MDAWMHEERERGREGGLEPCVGGEGVRVATLSRRVPAASKSGDFESRLLNAAEVVQRLFQAATSVESLTRPEREEDLLVLTLHFTAPVGLGAPPPAESWTT